jgi:hypothetical protein
MTPKTQHDRKRILAWLAAHPGSTVDDVARSGLYEPVWSNDSLNGARCWARHHLVAMRCAGVVEHDGTGRRRDPKRYSVASRPSWAEHSVSCSQCWQDLLPEQAHDGKCDGCSRAS